MFPCFLVEISTNTKEVKKAREHKQGNKTGKNEVKIREIFKKKRDKKGHDNKEGFGACFEGRKLSLFMIFCL